MSYFGAMIFNDPKFPSREALCAANINPETGLATDYLNLFNEYIMLAELVIDGSMEPDILQDWQPLDYEAHFVQSGFTGVKTVIAAFRALPVGQRDPFEASVKHLIELILTHQRKSSAQEPIDAIRHQRDLVSAFISGSNVEVILDVEDNQASIDALFD